MSRSSLVASLLRKRVGKERADNRTVNLSVTHRTTRSSRLIYSSVPQSRSYREYHKSFFNSPLYLDFIVVIV